MPAVLVAWLLIIPSAQAQVQVLAYDEYWPFHAVAQTVAEQALGPQSGNALAIVNNRPFSYETKLYDDDVSLLENFFNGDILKIAEFRDPATNYRLAELLLLKSLSVAQSRRDQEPWDVIGCHANLGMLYYQKADYRKSENHWLRAAQLAQGRVSNSRRLASILDCLAVTLRAEGKYAAAEDAYRKALGIRALVCGLGSSVTATSHMNLAMLYNDWQRPELEDFEINKVQGIMDHSVFISTTLTPGPRPVPTFMPAKTTIAGELPYMVSFAWNIINKPAQPSRLAATSTHARGSFASRRTGVLR